MMTSRLISVVGMAALLLACGKDKPKSPDAVAAAGGPSAASDTETATGATPAAAAQASDSTGGASTTGSAATSGVQLAETTLDSGTGQQIASCSELANKACSTLMNCAPYYLAANYGSLSQCTAAVLGACDHFNQLGQALDYQGCSAALSAPHCQAVFAYPKLPKVCLLPRGSKLAGATCGADSECKSLLCDKKGGCGTCVARVGRGAACGGSTQCEPGLVCNGATCTDPTGEGDACNDQVNCGAYTTCVAGTCQPTGTAGATCGVPSPRCNDPQGFVCTGTCTQTTVLNQGDTCATAGTTVCAGDLFCSSSSTAGKSCTPRPSFGQSCTSALCKTPLNCINGLCSYDELNSCTGQ